MEWTECGDESVLTCKAASVGMSMTVCVARCQCPYGKTARKCVLGLVLLLEISCYLFFDMRFTL